MEKALRYNEGKLRMDLVPIETLQSFLDINHSNFALMIPIETAIAEYQKGNDKLNDIYYIDIIGFRLLQLLENQDLLTTRYVFELTDKSFEPIANVFTMGAKKYEPQNWKKGASWSETLGSLLRHYRKWKLGLINDEESGVNHLAHAIVNAIFLRQFYYLTPWYDDRLKSYTILPKIILDLDDVVADFIGAYKSFYHFDSDVTSWYFSYKTAENLKELEKNKEFWINLPVLHRPDFIPSAYVSSREIPVEWSKEFLEKHNLPCREVYHVGYKESKVSILKELDCQVFIDDKLENVIAAQKAGIASYIMDNDHNKHFNMGYRRVYNLKIANILHT